MLVLKIVMHICHGSQAASRMLRRKLDVSCPCLHQQPVLTRLFKVLKAQVKLPALAENVQQGDDVGVVQRAQQLDLPHCCLAHCRHLRTVTVDARLELLDGDHLAALSVPAPQDGPKGALQTDKKAW